MTAAVSRILQHLPLLVPAEYLCAFFYTHEMGDRTHVSADTAYGSLNYGSPKISGCNLWNLEMCLHLEKRSLQM